MANDIARKTVDKFLEAVKLELKIPLVVGEIKFPVSDLAKQWWESKKRESDLEDAIQRSEQSFIAAYPDIKLAQILHDFPLYSEEDFKQVVAGLLTHLDEDKIAWLAKVKLEHQWSNLVSVEEIRNALELYLPYLRHELNGIKEFREIITARMLERIDQKTEKIDKTTERIEDKLDEALKPNQPKPISLRTGWFFGHRYGDIKAFTGRADELKMLSDWLDDDKDNLLVIRALGGFGKTALTWQWFNNYIDKEKWHTAIWWSFYEKESGFESFLTETLNHLGVETKDRSARQQVNDLLEAMHKTNLLIVLDGFERLLRQYGRMDAALQSDDEDEVIDPSQRDCTSMPAEIFLRGLSDETLRSKVLMTMRLFPRVLEGTDGKILKACREENLKAFSPDDAVAYFHKEGIAATRAEILEVCSAYGYHPLSLSLLVGLINEDHEHKGDILVAKKLDIFDDIKAKRHHVLQRAYESLSPQRRELLSKISCFRGSMEYDTIKKVFDNPDLEKSLIDLRKRGLLQYVEETKRYDMHPIVRHYAYDHFTDAKARQNTHLELAMHFIDVMPATNTKVKTLEDIAPVIELYHHMVRAGNLDEAIKLFRDRLASQLLYQFGAYQLRIELLRALFPDGEEKPPRLKKDDDQGWSLNGLANTYSLSGQPRRAVPVFQNAVLLAEKMNNKTNVAIGLGNVAILQSFIGALSEAERNFRRQIELGHEANADFHEAWGHQELGRVLIYRGVLQETEQELDAAIAIEVWKANIQGYGVNFAYRALRFLLMARDNPKSKIENLKSAIESAQRALELVNETAKTEHSYPVDYMRAFWLLGAAYRENKDLNKAEENLSKATSICRQINMVMYEADILLDIARLRYAQGEFKDAKEKADEALIITERSGYVLQGADVNLFLAQYALEQEKDKTKAKQYAETALKLATCDGPPYYYKVAYDEAVAMLERLNV